MKIKDAILFLSRQNPEHYVMVEADSGMGPLLHDVHFRVVGPCIVEVRPTCSAIPENASAMRAGLIVARNILQEHYDGVTHDVLPELNAVKQALSQ